MSSSHLSYWDQASLQHYFLNKIFQFIFEILFVYTFPFKLTNSDFRGYEILIFQLTVSVVVFFNFSESKGELPHPVDAASHAPGGQVDLGGRGVGPEPVRVEVVARQVLAVIITGHIVNMDLEQNISRINFKTFLSNLIIQIQ